MLWLFAQLFMPLRPSKRNRYEPNHCHFEFRRGIPRSALPRHAGFPTVAGGIRIGPKGASLSHYIFRVPRRVGDVWKQCIVEGKVQEMQQRALVQQALSQCNEARSDVLISMAYQMGVDGLALFRGMLTAVTQRDFDAAANAMLDSLWARQTRARPASCRSDAHGHLRHLSGLL